MDKPRVTPKDFFLWVGAMIALYVSVFSLISLFFSYIDYSFPDALNSYVDPYSTGMRFSIASLIVLFPLFLLLMRFIRRDIIRDATKKDIWVRRWALFFTIFAAGATVAIDLITLINYFLGGEVTTRFILKVVVVLLVASVGLMHFLADIWGYWNIYPQRARYVGWGVGALIVLTIIAGFFIMGTPSEIREYRFDDQRVGDLMQMQSQIVSYWQQKRHLPASLGDLNDPLSGMTVPVDPETSQAYSYATSSELSFKLCAQFHAPTQPNSIYARSRMAPMAAPIGPNGESYPAINSETWDHGAGQTCFTRTIDPEKYPPLSKPVS